MGIIEPMAIGSAALSGGMDFGGQGVWVPIVLLLAVAGGGIALSALRSWQRRVPRAARRVPAPVVGVRPCAVR